MSAYEFIISNKIIEFLKTDNIFLDFIIGSIVCSFFSYFFSFRFSSHFEKVKNYFLKKEIHKSSIYFEYPKKQLSETVKAILFYIINHNIKTITNIREEREIKYEYSNETEKKNTTYMYLPCNEQPYEITKDIFIEVSYKEKKIERGSYESYEDLTILELYSDVIDIEQLQNFKDCLIDEYNKYLTDTLLKNQCIINCSYSSESNSLSVTKTIFETNRNFDNLFFDQKDLLLKKVDKFLNGKEWYDERGIPYNLGIMLYGDPGCGKTSFIKSLLNYLDCKKEKRVHGIYVNLDDDFDLDTLENVITQEKIGDFKIPISNRLYIFEDIDCMGDVVKDRDIQDPSEKKMEDLLKAAMNNQGNKLPDNENTTSGSKKKNSLSKILNIFDGLIESPGRITIFTTNKLDVLDKALIRPGRVDIKINFTKCSCQMAIDIINKFYGANISKKHIEKYEEYSITPAELVQKCFENDTIDLLTSNL